VFTDEERCGKATEVAREGLEQETSSQQDTYDYEDGDNEELNQSHDRSTSA